MAKVDASLGSVLIYVTFMLILLRLRCYLCVQQDFKSITNNFREELSIGQPSQLSSAVSRNVPLVSASPNSER